ncbi:MAG: M23 family metallopeptidase, partial [Polyangiaceae bacterium]|nr:M23 family metallopeptidase [Polyangiaceae bacterium]
SADGKHCGGELGGIADHNSLYTCSGGATIEASPCQLGCENAACKVQMQQDPCASAMSGNGAYCGSGLVGGDPNALYTCQNGVTANKQQCPSGCQVNPPGVADKCAASGDPCANAASGNGLYCGGPLGGDANALYNCQNGQTANKQDCPAGCQQNPPGVPDSCKPSGGDQCCLEKPPGIITQSWSACGSGGSHYGIDYGTPIGTPIYAGMAGTVVGSALGFPNCYNNGCSPSCWNSFNYVKIKADCGDPNNAGKDFFIYYLHIDSLPAGISNGVHVEQGQLLAYAGNSGCSSGPHIHIETVSVDPGQSSSLNTCKSVDPDTRYCP